MKQKAKFVKAGPTVISIVYPLAFRKLCKELDVEPEIAINCLIKELTFYSVIFPVKTKAQTFASLLFSTMPGTISGLPAEPSQKKKKIGTELLLSLMEANSKIGDPGKLAKERKRIIRAAYLEYQKGCVCVENS